MLTFYFSDNTLYKLDLNKQKCYLDIKREIFNYKFKTVMNNKNDLVLITFGNIVNDDDEVFVLENQIFLVKINFNIHINKILNDDRLLLLLSNENNRNIINKILDKPELLLKLNEYQYQLQLEQIKTMNFKISEDLIKNLLDSNSGNIDLVVGAILNL
jgi:hypothetical protein